MTKFSMIAKFNGTCQHCGKRTIKGQDRITKSGANWVHLQCPTSDAPVQADSGALAGALDAAVASAPEAQPQAVRTQAVAPYWEHQCLENGRELVILTAGTDCFSCGERYTLPVEAPFVPSPYQQAIFDEIAHGTGNLTVEAVAGSGKSTTIIKALALLPVDHEVAFCAFNSHIAKALAGRAPAHVNVSTLHALGFANLRRVFGRVDVEDNKIETIMDMFLPVDFKAPVAERVAIRVTRGYLRKMVSLAKATLVDAKDMAALDAMALRYGIELDADAEVVYALVHPVLEAALAQTNVIDFDDMLWLPIALGMELHKFDDLFVDEAQDLNACQIQFVLRSVKAAGRIYCVGDRNQSLYGFRGADTDAIPNIIAATHAKVLPLSISYRCPTSHVELAQAIVPQIEARIGAPVGEILTIKENKLHDYVQTGDMLLCRVNAPLISVAFELIRRGIKATVRGRDIGKNLTDLIKKFNADSLYDLDIKLGEYVSKETERLLRKPGREMQVENLIDRSETIRAVMSDCSTVQQIIAKLESLFSDETSGVVLSSVHRAKGLEAANVYILKPQLMPHPKAAQGWQAVQEQNIKYVAYTRSTDKLYFVTE